MNLTNIKKILKNEPRFRYKQIEKALYSDFIDDWNSVSSLPKILREKLDNECSLEIKAENTVNTKTTQKVLLTMFDGLQVETVLMRHIDNRNTVCVSSQVGCPLGCEFCATGTMGFKRNLSTDEIVEQVLYFSRLLKSEEKRVTNVVFMGMGEPMLNYDNVIKAIYVLNDEKRFNIGARKISISTSGIVEGIKKLTKEKLQINLAISLHAPGDKLRTKLMSINKSNPLKKVLGAVDNYIEKTHRKVMFEYLLINGVNDTEKNAIQLSVLMKKPLYGVNLIPYNPIQDKRDKFKTSKKDQIARFKKILNDNGVQVIERYEFGSSIAAACGQLVVK